MRREGLMVGKYHAWLSSTITGAAHLALSVDCMDAGCDLATIAAAVHRVGRQAHAGWLPIKVSTVTCVRLSGTKTVRRHHFARAVFFRALQCLVCGTDLSTNLQHLVRIRAVFLVLLQCNIWFAAVQHFVCCIVQFESTHVTEGAADKVQQTKIATSKFQETNCSRESEPDKVQQTTCNRTITRGNVQ